MSFLRASLFRSASLFRGGFVRPITGRIPTRFWQQVYEGDKIYYVDTDTYERTSVKPEEYVPHEAMESRLVRGLKMDAWGDQLKPTPQWQNYAGYALFTTCMGYLLYVIVYSKYQANKKEQETTELHKERTRKAAALALSRSNSTQ